MDTALLEQLKVLETKAASRPADSDASETTAALLRRVQNAENQASELKRQLATASAASAAAVTTSGVGAGGGKSSGGKAAGVGANPAEVRKLQKRIKELEASGGGGGGGGSAVDKKAALTMEKKFQKQLKDAETAARKDKAIYPQSNIYCWWMS